MDEYLLETCLNGALLRSCGVLVISPITPENMHLIQSGELVWDDKIHDIACYLPDNFEDGRFYMADKDSLTLYKNLADRYDRRF